MGVLDSQMGYLQTIWYLTAMCYCLKPMVCSYLELKWGLSLNNAHFFHWLLVWGLQRSCAGRKWRWGVDSANATYAPHTIVGALKLTGCELLIQDSFQMKVYSFLILSVICFRKVICIDNLLKFNPPVTVISFHRIGCPWPITQFVGKICWDVSFFLLLRLASLHKRKYAEFYISTLLETM